MKLKGQAIPPPVPVNVSFYRGKDIFKFTIAPVLSFDEFEKLVSSPKPPLVTKISTGARYQDYDNDQYKAKFHQYVDLKTSYALIKGLEATEELEWDRVKLNEPDTWHFYRDDLNSCLTEGEIVELLEAVREANNPTEKRQQEAFDSFIASQAQAVVSPSQEVGQEDSQSGEPAKDSE